MHPKKMTFAKNSARKVFTGIVKMTKIVIFKNGNPVLDRVRRVIFRNCIIFVKKQSTRVNNIKKEKSELF